MRLDKMALRILKTLFFILLIFCAIFLLYRIDKKESYTSVLLIQVPAVPKNIVVDETHLYWSNLGSLGNDGKFDDDVINGSIMKADLDGNNIVTLASNLYPPAAIAIDENYLYWIASDGIMKVNKQGGEIVHLVSWNAPLMESNDYYDSGVAINGDIIVDEKFVYWAKSGATSDLSKVNKNGGDVIVLVSNQDYFDDIEINENNVYWFGSDGTISTITKLGTDYQQLVMNQTGITSIAVDKDYLYWANDINFTGGNDNQIIRLPLSGGKSDVIFRGYFHGNNNLKLYNSNLFWIKAPTVGEGVLMKSETAGNSSRELVAVYPLLLPNLFAINSKGIFIVQMGSRRIYYIENTKE